MKLEKNWNIKNCLLTYFQFTDIVEQSERASEQNVSNPRAQTKQLS